MMLQCGAVNKSQRIERTAIEINATCKYKKMWPLELTADTFASNTQQQRTTPRRTRATKCSMYQKFHMHQHFSLIFFLVRCVKSTKDFFSIWTRSAGAEHVYFITLRSICYARIFHLRICNFSEVDLNFKCSLSEFLSLLRKFIFYQITLSALDWKKNKSLLVIAEAAARAI